MAAGYGNLVAGVERGRMRASDADRDRVAQLLNTAFIEGRLSKEEHDGRLETALAARTYADLDKVTIDLPTAAGPASTPVPAPVAKTNDLAIASLACGLAQILFGPLTAIPAIILGHMARAQIRRTGEQGDGLALTGLVLGWGVVILGIAVAVVAVAIFGGMFAAVHH